MDHIFYILDKDSFEPVYLIENYKYGLWTDRYDDTGDFEIQVTPTPGIIKNALLDNYIINPGNKVDNQMMIIENIETVLDESGEVLVKLSGRSTESILDRRVLQIKTVFKNNLEDCIKQLVKHSFYDLNFSGGLYDGFMRQEYARVNNIGFEYSSDSSINTISLDTTEFNYGTSCLEIVKQFTQGYNLGFQVEYKKDSGSCFGGNNIPNRFILGLVSYTDKSDSIIFSRKLDNLVSSDYKKSSQDYKNYIYTYGKYYDPGGQSELSNKTTWQSMAEDPSVEGLYIREMVNDASDINYKTTDVYGHEETLSSNQYHTAFKNRANRLFIENAIKEESDSKIIENYGFKYGKDFFIGDLVGGVDGYGNSLKMQVAEYITSYDQNGIVGYPKFRVFKKRLEE